MKSTKPIRKKNTYSDLLLSWSPENPDKISDYTHGSHHVALWVCEKGHTWLAQVKTRYAGYNCPFCSGRNVIPGVNDLATIRPDVASLWHPTKNSDCTPQSVTYSSRKRVWWICEKKHEWYAPVISRTRKGASHCPICSHHRFSHENSLAVNYPLIAQEWDYESNINSPDQVSAHSNKYAYWICNKGHHWKSMIYTRTRSNRPGRCPYCSGKRVIPGVTDLLTTDPEIAAEWSFLNTKLSPSGISRCSHALVYWNCSKGHIYKASPANRVHGRGCPCNRNRFPSV